jgi:hypothetical protein
LPAFVPIYLSCANFSLYMAFYLDNSYSREWDQTVFRMIIEMNKWTKLQYLYVGISGLISSLFLRMPHFQKKHSPILHLCQHLFPSIFLVQCFRHLLSIEIPNVSYRLHSKQSLQ